MTYASMDDLLARADNPGEDITLPSGAVVKVRGLSRGEALRGASIRGADAIERHLLECGMVEPACTPDQAKALQAAPKDSDLARDVDAIVGAVMDRSAMGADATKSRGAGDAAGPDAPVRALAGAEAGKGRRRGSAAG